MTFTRHRADRGRSPSLIPALAIGFLFAVPALVAASPPGEVISPTEQEVVDLVNEERAKVGAPPLIVNYSLQDAAWVHNEHMTSIGRICHAGCGDGDPGQRVAATGYRAITVGENVAQGYRSPRAVMDAWMSSSGHRGNILNRRYTDIGVAHNPSHYWTQVFSTPRTDYATVTPPSGGSGGGGGGGGTDPEPTPDACRVAMDFDGDHAVTMADVELVRGAFMATSGDPRWDPAYDVVPNGLIDLYDVFEVILAVGTTGCGS